MVQTLLVRKKNYARTSKKGTHSTSPMNLPTKALKGSPTHPGRIGERLVRSFKRVIFTILGTSRLTDEFLSTTFCLVEPAINSRRLTPVSAALSDLGALTHNHFLLGNQASSLTFIIGVDEFHHLKRYARAQS